VLAKDPELAELVASIGEGRFSDGDRSTFEPLVRGLTEYDPFFVLADFRAYIDTQRKVEQVWNDPERWAKMAIHNVASMGHFSSDRSIREYAQQVWRVEPVHIQAQK
jgi:starch phosphorylase